MKDRFAYMGCGKLRWFSDRKRRLAAALLAAMAVTTAVAGSTAPRRENFVRQPAVMAWWGTLYPQFCFSEKPAQGKPKISFRLAQLFDWCYNER